MRLESEYLARYEAPPTKGSEAAASSLEIAGAGAERRADEGEEAGARGQEGERTASADELEGLRVHCWVVVLPGRQEIAEPFYIEPSTGRVVPLSRAAEPDAARDASRCRVSSAASSVRRWLSAACSERRICAACSASSRSCLTRASCARSPAVRAWTCGTAVDISARK